MSSKVPDERHPASCFLKRKKEVPVTLHPTSNRVQVHVYLTIDELETIDKRCTLMGMSRATYMRVAVLEAVRKANREET